jgi:hypothetical protein
MNEAYIGISLGSKSTSGLDGVSAVLLGSWYQEVDVHTVLEKIVTNLAPEVWPSLIDTDIGGMLISHYPFLQEFQKWIHSNPIGLFMESLGYKCDFSNPTNTSPSGKITFTYGYGTWNNRIYNRMLIDLANIVKRSHWFKHNRPLVEEALKKRRIVAKVMDT